MKKDDRVFLAHMRDAMERIIEYASIDQCDYMADYKTQDAIVRQFEVLGEAAKQLSSGFRKRYSEIPWSDMARLRDKAIHDYMGISIGLFWKFGRENAPADLEKVQAILDELGEPE